MKRGDSTRDTTFLKAILDPKVPLGDVTKMDR